MTLLRHLVRTWRSLANRPLPPPVVHAARLHLLDALGVGLAALQSPAGKVWRTHARTLPPGPGSVLGRGAGAPPADAALCNGGLVHGLEYDDTRTGSIIHGSAVLATAALAVGEAEGASGRDVLAAYALGWDVLVRIGLAAPGRFQVTSVGGAPVAALVAASLMGLDEEGMLHAAAVALSQSSGTFEFAFMPDSGFPVRFAAEVTVRMADGSERRARVDDVRGNPGRPVPEGDVLAKFRRNAARALPDPAPLERVVLSLDDLPDLAPLSAALQARIPA